MSRLEPRFPPHMVIRKWKNKHGIECYAYYYQSPPDPLTRKRELIPLGTDLANARRKWAELENVTLARPPAGTLKFVHQEYMKWANKRLTSGLSIRTIEDREKYWKVLEPVYGHISVDEFRSSWLLKYFEDRTAKVSAKKEIKYLSVLFNWAKARDLMNASNPCAGIMTQLKVKENRGIYVPDISYNLVWECGDQVVRDAMDFMYMCGTRPEEALEAKKTDIVNNELHITIFKTENSGARIKRLPVDGDLKRFIERQRERKISSVYLLSDEAGQPLSQVGQLRYRFRRARDLAAAIAKKREISFVWFQFKDIRAKAATDTAIKYGIEEARKLLGHSTQKQTADYVRPMMGEAAKALEKPLDEKVNGPE